MNQRLSTISMQKKHATRNRYLVTRYALFVFLMVFGAHVARATPGVSPITGVLTLCAGTTTALSDATSGGTWSSSTTSVATVAAASGVVYGVSGGTTTITYTVGTSSATEIVTVNGAPVITSLSMSSAFPAASVTIGGNNFNSSASANLVYFGATQAVVSSSTATSITVTVPTGATYMPVSVENTSCNLSAWSAYPIHAYLQRWNLCYQRCQFQYKNRLYNGRQPY